MTPNWENVFFCSTILLPNHVCFTAAVRQGRSFYCHWFPSPYVCSPKQSIYWLFVFSILGNSCSNIWCYHSAGQIVAMLQVSRYLLIFKTLYFPDCVSFLWIITCFIFYILLKIVKSLEIPKSWQLQWHDFSCWVQLEWLNWQLAMILQSVFWNP